MGKDVDIESLGNIDIELSKNARWKLEVMFVDDIAKEEITHEKATKFAKKLSAQLHVGIRTVTLSKSVFMEICKKKTLFTAIMTK